MVRYNTCTNEVHNPSQYLFGANCPSCGSMTSYADDSTFASSSRSRTTNQNTLYQSLENIKIFLYSNKLSINESKTCLLETMNHQKRSKTAGSPPSLMVLDENNILVEKSAVKECRLLGANIGQDLTWRAHLVTGEMPLLAALRKKVGILSHLCKKHTIKEQEDPSRGTCLE